MMDPILRRASQSTIVPQAWGELTWFANGALGNSDAMTIGRCRILPGCANPRHRHPNCSEILVVIQGRILHSTAAGTDTELNAGDTLTIPAGFAHRAINIGIEDAILMLSYSSPDREVVGE